MARTSLGLGMIALALLGCATVTSHDEYGHYRAVRLANSDRARLIAMQQYVASHPDGYWAEEIQAERTSRENDVWGQSNATREGLHWYLEVYPDGEFVEQARVRLQALESVADSQAEETRRQRELEASQLAEAAEARRTWVTRAVQFWARTLLTVHSFGDPMSRIARGNAEFSRAFGQAPAPVCTPDYCIKHYGQLYHIPVPGATRIERRIDVYLRLALERGRLQRAEILLPSKGFSRWYEMENQTVVTDEDPEQRMTAINWALDRIQPLIQEIAPNATQIDVVPEPIPPLQIHAEASDSEEAPVGPDEAAPEATPMQDPSQGGEGTGIDSLLNDATGGEQPRRRQPEPQVQASENIVLPTGLLSFRHSNLQVVVFAAGDEDYEQGFDGIIIERAP